MNPDCRPRLDMEVRGRGRSRRSIRLPRPRNLPEPAWSQDAHWYLAIQCEKILIACHQYLGSTRHGARQNPGVSAVPDLEVEDLPRFGNDLVFPEECLSLGSTGGGKFELGGEHALKLVQNDGRDQQFVLREHHMHNVGRQAPGGKGGDKHIGVEADPHDTSR